jgi:hypothetical protein
MHRAILPAILAISVFTVLPVAAQWAPGVERGGRPGSLAAHAQWAQFQIVGGRITADSPNLGQTMTSSATHGDRKESISISHSDGSLLVNYELSTPLAQTSIVIEGRGTASIRRVPRGDSTDPAVHFRQLAGRRMMLTVGEGPDERTIEGPTLWHLLLADPNLARERLLPLLALIQNEWSLAEDLEKVEQGLFRGGAARQAPDRQAWAALVAGLSSNRYAARQAADRKLRAGGPAIVPFLRSLDFAQLDAEQQHRIRRMVADLAEGDESDTPLRVTRWLVWDPHLWFLLLARDDEAVRRVAAEQLSLLLDEPIDFDPAAALDVRQAQIERLRPRFALEGGEDERGAAP